MLSILVEEEVTKIRCAHPVRLDFQNFRQKLWSAPKLAFWLVDNIEYLQGNICLVSISIEQAAYKYYAQSSQDCLPAA